MSETSHLEGNIEWGIENSGDFDRDENALIEQVLEQVERNEHSENPEKMDQAKKAKGAVAIFALTTGKILNKSADKKE